MDNQDLFAAIGNIDDTYLLELAQPKVRRLPKRFGLIAALITLLLTACAAPAVIRSFDKLQDGQPAENGRGVESIVYSPGMTAEEATHRFIPSDVELKITVNPEAPSMIEEYYIPKKLLDYCSIEACTNNKTEFSLTLSMDVPRFGRVYGAFYRQCVLPEEGKVVVQDIFGSEPYAKKKNHQTYADVTALEFTGRAWYSDANGGPLLYDGNRVAAINTKHIFWSDGFYLYCLKIPFGYPVTAGNVEEIVTSLTAVENISDYLVETE